MLGLVCGLTQCHVHVPLTHVFFLFLARSLAPTRIRKHVCGRTLTHAHSRTTPAQVGDDARQSKRLQRWGAAFAAQVALEMVCEMND